MQNYKKVLVAVELIHEADRPILEKAQFFAQQSADIYLIHAVEHINAYGSAQAYPAIADVEQQISEEHQQMLDDLAKTLNVNNEHKFVEIGPPATIVAEKAAEINADLVILGSHGRHGLAALLGSTTDSVLHKAKCDLLAVRLPDAD